MSQRAEAVFATDPSTRAHYEHRAPEYDEWWWQGSGSFCDAPSCSVNIA